MEKTRSSKYRLDSGKKSIFPLILLGFILSLSHAGVHVQASQQKADVPDPNSADKKMAYIEGSRGWLDNGCIKLAVDRRYGGAIVYASASQSEENMVNIADKGRQIQQSYYAGKTLNRQDAGQSPHWSPWAWNPVQAGNFAGDQSIVLRFETRRDDSIFYTKCQPRLWDMDEEPAKCYFHQWMQFEPGMDNVIRVTNKIECFRDPTDIWGPPVPRSQELPAVYLIRKMSRMFIYDGSRPWQNQPLTQVQYGPNDTWIWTKQKPTEPWAACVYPDTRFGLGVYSPEGAGHTWNMGWTGGPNGTEYSGPTMHFAPISRWNLGPDTVRIFKYWIMIGSLDDLRSRAYQLHHLYGD